MSIIINIEMANWPQKYTILYTIYASYDFMAMEVKIILKYTKSENHRLLNYCKQYPVFYK